MVSTRTERITAPVGGQFDAHVAIPDVGSGSGIMLIQEIGGVNSYVRAVGERLADLGYVVLAPDVFWRIQPNFAVEVLSPDTLDQALAVSHLYDPVQGLADLGAALEHLRELPEVTGGAGVLGFCFGGTQAFLCAAEYDLDVAVSYYGSGVAGSIERVKQVQCPLLLHFGGADPLIPAEDLERIKAATAAMPNVEILVQPGASHAFDNHVSEAYWNPPAAAAAWERTATFLGEHLPPQG